MNTRDGWMKLHVGDVEAMLDRLRSLHAQLDTVAARARRHDDPQLALDIKGAATALEGLTDALRSASAQAELQADVHRAVERRS